MHPDIPDCSSAWRNAGRPAAGGGVVLNTPKAAEYRPATAEVMARTAAGAKTAWSRSVQSGAGHDILIERATSVQFKNHNIHVLGFDKEKETLKKKPHGPCEPCRKGAMRQGATHVWGHDDHVDFIQRQLLMTKYTQMKSRVIIVCVVVRR